MNATKTRAYRTTLTKPAPYPLNWDNIAETFDSLEAATAKAEEWMARYPKNVAKGIVKVEIDSWSGISQDGWRLLGRKIHFNSKKTVKK